ncbi:hypothetical protein Agabi119p4_6219 [Agaricus bisporus var. burnettii]|uniref:DUF6534 domain-containing protein n=1 Tax=Agaricus bisporus var. burnettii TaxID=192524 RepID=A0A8H7EZS3_AGABI|nr:hypothetical protein Agabi119p4_6219 [Agaricus bisporus var. burnettii]
MSIAINLDNTMGVAFIGVVIAGMLYGVSVIQVYYYCTNQTDTWSIKLLVGSVMFFETIHQILITHSMYMYLVKDAARPEMLNKLIWSLLVEVLFNGLTAFVVQSFLTMRVWRLSNRKIWLTGAAVLLVIGEFGCVVAFTALSLRLKTYAQLAELKSLSIAVNALAAAGDLIIAASLCIILHQSRTGFQRSDTMIKKLIVYSVNTGLLTSLCAVASLISIVLAGQTFLYIMFFFCIGRLYSNSLLATLNARKSIRAAADAINNTSEHVSVSLREFSRAGGTTGIVTKRPTNISIKIDTTKEFNSDRMVYECERNDGVAVGRDLEEKRNEIGMTFARKASSLMTTTTYAERTPELGTENV